MPLATVQELIDLKRRDINASVYKYASTPYGHDGGSVRASLIDEAEATSILERHFNAILNNVHGKATRPWHIVDITKKLDPAQPWLGFEFETGFETEAIYQKIINFVWKNVDHVAIDKEGYGRFCPEFTFSPENLSNYMEGKSAIQRTLMWMKENKIRMADFGDHPVGTHLNISTPTFRSIDRSAQERVTRLIAHSLLFLNKKDHKELFGRTAYGVGQLGEGNWIEFKIFRSTDDAKVFDQYLRISQRMAELVEHLSRAGVASLKTTGTDYIHNIVELLTGKAIEPVIVHTNHTVNMSYIHWRRSRSDTDGLLGEFRRSKKEYKSNAA